MQFVADENVSHRVVERLRADGHDVMLVAEMRSGMSDTDVLKLAETETCILVTEDQDFGELIFRQHLSVLGVVLLSRDSRAAQRIEVPDHVGDSCFGCPSVGQPAESCLEHFSMWLTYLCACHRPA